MQEIDTKTLLFIIIYRILTFNVVLYFSTPAYNTSYFCTRRFFAFVADSQGHAVPSTNAQVSHQRKFSYLLVKLVLVNYYLEVFLNYVSYFENEVAYIFT